MNFTLLERINLKNGSFAPFFTQFFSVCSALSRHGPGFRDFTTGQTNSVMRRLRPHCRAA
jgi:hypothetical protein